MSNLVALPFVPALHPLPEAHRGLGVAALDLATTLSDLANPDRCPGFVMTPPHVAWSLVVAARGLVPNPDAVFCEWGAGIGLVTLLAARAGFDAWGVENEPALLRAAAILARSQGEMMRVVSGSYKPDGFFEGRETPDRRVLSIQGRDLTAADVIFVYAWPTEVSAVRGFFHAHAAQGAILVLYEGGRTFSAYRQDSGSAASNPASPRR